MRHNDWVIFMRCMDCLAFTSSIGLMLGSKVDVWTVGMLGVSVAIGVASLVADGYVGSWRERRDYEEYVRAHEENARLGRQLRRMRDMCEWEARHDA